MTSYEKATVISAMHAMDVTAEVDLRYAIRVMQKWTEAIEVELRERKGKGAADRERKRAGAE